MDIKRHLKSALKQLGFRQASQGADHPDENS